MNKNMWCVVIAGVATLFLQVTAFADEPTPAQTAPVAPDAPRAQPAAEAAPAAAVPGAAPVPAAAAEAADDDTPPKEELAKLNVPKAEWYDRIKTMARTTMLNVSAKDYQEAEKKVLEIKDPNALEPMALALYTRDTRWRGTFLKATKQYAQSKNEAVAPLAVTYLSDIAVLDPNPILRGQARAALIQNETPRYPARIQHHLTTSTDSAVRNRAAGLLADRALDLAAGVAAPPWRGRLRVASAAASAGAPLAASIAGVGWPHGVHEALTVAETAGRLDAELPRLAEAAAAEHADRARRLMRALAIVVYVVAVAIAVIVIFSVYLGYLHDLRAVTEA